MTTKSLRERLRSHRRVYHAYRNLIMRYRRWRYGLRNVHPTFYMSGKSVVSADLIAHEYAFLGDGCRIGPNDLTPEN